MTVVMTHKWERQAIRESYSPDYHSAKSPDMQMVDPQFNELLFKFQFVTANIEALYHACEQYKRSLRCFFSETAKMLELFHELLDERDLAIPHPPSPKLPELTSLESVETPIFPKVANPVIGNDATLDIGRLRRQMLVIARRTEQDLLFFENSVQGPLAQLINMSNRIKRVTSRREAANAEWGQLAAKHHDLIRKPFGIRQNKQQQLESGLFKKLQEALTKYDTLNEMCKEGLENYLELLRQLFREWFRNYYYTILRIAYALHHLSWSIPEFRRIGAGHVASANEPSSPSTLPSSVPTRQLCQEFHALHDAAAKQLVTLLQGAPNGTTFAL